MALKRLYIAITLVSILLLLASCGSNGCYENRSSIPMAKFYAYNYPTKTVSIDSISIYGIGQRNDSLLLDCARRVSSLQLPLRNDADTTQYVIRYETKSIPSSSLYNDTLTWIYTRYPYFISGDCGVVFNYAIDTVLYTRNMLDSVAVMVDEVTNQDQETIRLYYYVATD